MNKAITFSAPIILCFVIALAWFSTSQADTHKDKILNVEVIDTPHATDAWLVNDPSVPVVAVSLSFPDGISEDPDGLEGLTSFMSILLDEGAGEYDAQSFQKMLADNSISLSFSAGRDAFTVSIKTLKRNLDKAIELANLAMTKARFDADAITRMKNARSISIKRDLTSPGWIASRSFNGMLYEGDVYARPGQGTLASIEAITVEDLRARYTAQFKRGGIQIAFAGDIDVETAVEKIEKLLGNLPDGDKAKDDDDKAKLTNLGTHYHHTFDNPQTHIIFGHEGLYVTDEDWPAAQIVNYILGGGGFDSRLMTEVREKRGLTYGIGTGLSSNDRAALIRGSLSTSNDNAAEAIKLIRSEWQRMATTGPTDEEVQNAKNYLTGSLLLNLTSTDSIAGALNGLQQFDFDAEYINRRNARLKAVTPDTARAVAGRLLDPKQLFFVSVGGAENLDGAKPLNPIPGAK